jgi:sarcosine oxidase subunit alpha
LYEGNLIGAFAAGRLLKIRAGQVIVCTGTRQRHILFANNDLPGIFLGDGVLRLARLYGVRAGWRAVVATDNDDGHALAGQLAALGIEVAAVLDRRPAGGGQALLRARGRSRLRAVEVAQLAEGGTVVEGSAQVIACDLLCLASRRVPANELLHQGGMRFAFRNGRWLPSLEVPGLLAAGAAAGTFDQEAQRHEGRYCGRDAAAAIGHTVPFDNGPLPAEGQDGTALPTGPEAAAGKCFVCLCDDVTTKDLDLAVAEGFDHIETLKRYATVGMGPCQGKVCGQTFSEVCALLTGREVNAVGTTTSRPPAVPVELEVLAAERRHQPVRRTPLHHWHQAAGACWLDAGQWKRPESYGDPAAEVQAVRTAAGLIDVSTLGKIEVRGPGAVELLERVYLNRWLDLLPGRARYGVMCTEEGIVFDDGVGACLGEEHFYLTATTGNAEAVFQWLELWRTTWRLDALVQNRTAALAAVNLAGPRSREVLARLAGLDLSPAAFRYMWVREAEVAGVPCRLLRVGFVGELGYEIHCPACHAWHLWQALLDAGASFGLRPFGVEAQRILRLEKGHPIVGQDTDATSDPFGACLGRLVAFDKRQFHGREPLERIRKMKGRPRLVGFQVVASAMRGGNDGWARRLEGCQVVEQSRPVGRVTSARYSPTLGQYIGLAWVPEDRATPPERFLIRCDGTDVPAQVALVPFYDLLGQRLKN